MDVDIEAQLRRAFKRIESLEQEVSLLRRGGCRCERPEWYFANLISTYRCGKCGAVVSSRLLPPHLQGD